MIIWPTRPNSYSTDKISQQQGVGDEAGSDDILGQVVVALRHREKDEAWGFILEQVLALSQWEGDIAGEVILKQVGAPWYAKGANMAANDRLSSWNSCSMNVKWLTD